MKGGGVEEGWRVGRRRERGGWEKGEECGGEE